MLTTHFNPKDIVLTNIVNYDDNNVQFDMYIVSEEGVLPREVVLHAVQV